MLKKIVFLTFLLTILTISSCEQGTKKVFLRYKHKVGDVLIYDATYKNNIKVIQADTVSKENSVTSKYRMTSTIKRILEDSVYESYVVSVRLSETIITRDSTIEMGEDTAWVRIIYFNAKGKTIDIEFPEPMNEAYEDYIKESYKQGFPVFPENEVFVGYSWTQTTQVLLKNEPSVSSTTYTIKSFAREKGYDCVLIDYKGNMVIPIKPEENNPNKRGGVDRIDMKGVMYYAYKEGLTVSIRENWLMNGERIMVKEKGDSSSYLVKLEGDYTETLIDRKVN